MCSHVHLGAFHAAVLLISALVLTAAPLAAQAPDENRARIHRLENALLAPCCYTDAVSRHQSEAAVKMRLEIAKSVASGKTDQQILDEYVERYGSKVLVDPRTIPGWWAPWIPWLALVCGVVLCGFWLFRRWRAGPVAAPAEPPGPDITALPDFENEK